MQVIVLFLPLLVYQAAARQYDFCYAEDDEPYLFFGTKTSYHFVHGGNIRFQSVPGCQPVQIWMASRHGARYPKPETVTKLLTLEKFREQIVHNHEHRRSGRMCNDDLDKLKLWNPDPNLTASMALRLTSSGAESARLLARRLQSNFPDLLRPNSVNITSQNYKFRSTNSERTRQSMASFMEGLFGPGRSVPTIEAPGGNDTLLKAYKHCTAWLAGFDDDALPFGEERDKFIKGPEMANVIQNVSSRLGFQYPLLFEPIELMYDMCRLEKAWKVDNILTWCTAFSKEELRVLEYAEDLYYNYGAGNGRKINERMGCPLIQDMFNHFKELERGELAGKPKGIFYFTHAVTILNFLTAMGIGTDSEPLLATNYRQMGRRQFRTSYIAPFNSNLAAVFYRCNSNAPNKVMFYLQEKLVLLDGCDAGLCDWEYLKNKFGSIASECNIDFCWDGSGVAANYAWNLVTILGIPLFLSLFSQ